MANCSGFTTTDHDVIGVGKGKWSEVPVCRKYRSGARVIFHFLKVPATQKNSSNRPICTDFGHWR